MATNSIYAHIVGINCQILLQLTNLCNPIAQDIGYIAVRSQAKMLKHFQQKCEAVLRRIMREKMDRAVP
ncbi:hypothetical protein QBD01_002737 [Ochrobactrum sp. 19YEA23]|uniref:hypothetical protein n=1 Tax=Ochrobactrum sp. 19YEA23 TaxID=3039854 RepID=UPI00247A9092|nr:hypothetical protein [Ochrobactrum sp. 19YEA23]